MSNEKFVFPSLQGLNAMQRGQAHKTIVWVLYFLIGMVLLYGFESLEQKLLISSAQKWASAVHITQPEFQKIIDFIGGQDLTYSFGPKLTYVMCAGLIIFFILRFVAKCNWASPVTLNRAVEFSWAMQQLGIQNPFDRIKFAVDHEIPLFFADNPILGTEQENVTARLYAFNNTVLATYSILEQHIGRQTLCLHGDDYDFIQQRFGQMTNLAQSRIISTLETDIQELKGTNRQLQDDLQSCKEEKENLLRDFEGVKNQQRTASARETRNSNRESDRIPFWRVAGPLLNKMIAEASPNTRYTRPQIQEAFEEILEDYEDLKPDLQKLLETPKKVEDGTPFSLEGWAMDAIRSGLGEHAQTKAGAKSKG